MTALLPDLAAGGLLAPAHWHERLRAAPCAAVVVHYRRADETAACLASLRAAAPDTPVVVVDNDGGDQPQRQLIEGCEREGAALLVMGRNAGFGAGCNAGIDAVLRLAAGIEHVLLINPDARALPGAVDRLRQTAAEHPDAGIVGGCTLTADGGRVEFENGRLRPWTLTRMHCAAPAVDRPFETTFVTGALMLIDAGMLRAGLRFDEEFFLYAEDLDLCCEVRARGRTLWIDPRAVALHRGGGTGAGATVLGALTASQVYWLARSKVLFARKRLSWCQRAVALGIAALAKPILGLLIARSARFLAPHLRGLWDGLRARRPRASRPIA
jgi:GT2 family glycosyltransferase